MISLLLAFVWGGSQYAWGSWQIIGLFVLTAALFGMFGAIAFIPLYAQSVVRFSATNSGLVLAPMSAGIIISSGIAGQIISRTGKYKASSIIGMAIAVAGMYLFSQLSVDTSSFQLVADMG